MTVSVRKGERCLKCGGELSEDRDVYGAYTYCLRCGWEPTKPLPDGIDQPRLCTTKRKGRENLSCGERLPSLPHGAGCRWGNCAACSYPACRKYEKEACIMAENRAGKEVAEIAREYGLKESYTRRLISEGIL